MVSYPHADHAGNLADVHKHAILAEMLALLVLNPPYGTDERVALARRMIEAVPPDGGHAMRRSD